MGMLGHPDRRHTAESDRQRTRPFAIGHSPRGTEASMHRSRPLVLVIVAAAAAAACSKHDPSEGTDLLSQDRTPVARLEPSRDTQRTSVPDACGAITLAAAPSTANKQR